VLRDPKLLLLDAGKTLKPTVSALQSSGFSLSHITRLFHLYPSAFSRSSLEQIITFWMPIVGSVDNLFYLLKNNRDVLTAHLDEVVAPNLHVFQKRCGLSGSQIVEMAASRLLTKNPEDVKEIVKRAMQFQVPTSSPLFTKILLSCAQKTHKFESKIKSLMSMGLSEAEVFSMIRKTPLLLRISAQVLLCKANFLTKEVGLDPATIASNPLFLMLSMNKRLVSRHHVMMKLKAAHLPDGRKSYYCVLSIPEQKFLDKFVFPNLNIIPDLYSTYTAIAGMEPPTKRSLNDLSELLRALEFSESQVSDILKREPKLITQSEQQMQAKIDFLLTHVGLDQSYIATHPKILKFSLERRLIPRYYVLQCLALKGLVRNNSILNAMAIKEVHFMEQFISSYEHIIPGLAENYDSARAGKALKYKHRARMSSSPK
jgi:mTERF domain-containing protein, mitochondrial